MGRRRIEVTAELVVGTLAEGNVIERARVERGLPEGCQIVGVGTAWRDDRNEANTVWFEVEHASFAGPDDPRAPAPPLTPVIVRA